MDRRKRDPWLDGLRGAAIVLVLGRHIDLPDGAPALLACWQRGGWVGVDLFFVLSGFLVAGLLFREYQRRGALALPRFLVRRALRIYPAFALLLICTWSVGRATGVPPVSGRALLAELFFVQNYVHGVWNHTWSLAVEEHFYVVLPLMLLGMATLGRGKADPFRALIPIGLVTMVALALLRCGNAWRMPYTHPTHLFPTHLRIDALGAGALLAYVFHFHRGTFDRLVLPRRGWLLLLGIACFAPAFLFELDAAPLVPTLGLTLFALGSVAIIAASPGPTAASPVRWLAPLGVCSYSIYLWHMPVLVWGVPWCEAALGFHLGGAARIGAYLIGSVIVGAVMATLVERPWLWLRDRWFPAQPDGYAMPEEPPLRQCA